MKFEILADSIKSIHDKAGNTAKSAAVSNQFQTKPDVLISNLSFFVYRGKKILFTFEFLGLDAKDAVTESDLEQALMDHLQEFMLKGIEKMGLFDKFKNKNVDTEEEKKKKIAQETIDTYLSKFKDVDGYYATLSRAGRDIISDMIAHEDEEMVLKVLEAAEDVNKEDNDGFSYLSFACLEHKVEVIEMLLSKGANPNHKNKRGSVPLLHALGRRNPNNPKILSLFIEYGVDLKMDINGNTIEETIRSFEEDELNEILDKNI